MAERAGCVSFLVFSERATLYGVSSCLSSSKMSSHPVKRKVDSSSSGEGGAPKSMAAASAVGLAEESPSRARVRTESWEADPKAGPSVLSKVLMKHTDTPVTATLRLKDSEDSYVEFSGFSFGARTSVCGEVVFNTGMVGYPEALTDPSYRGQILVLTYPLVGNYGVPDQTIIDEHGLPKYFESNEIHIRALIVSDYSLEHSHWAAKKSLGDWLKAHNIPAVFGIDTRMLTKKLRESGTMLGAVVHNDADEIEFEDPNKLNLVAEVSTKAVRVYGKGNSKKVIAFDCGMKFNIIRYLASLDVELSVVPYDFDLENTSMSYDGIFISNGPGDPTMAEATVKSVRWALTQDKPIFGICLGNQILALAAGARTFKLKYGNRGMNQPCVDLRTARCYITPQNHGFAVDPDSLPQDWRPMFMNANDYTNEGIIHVKRPFFSVQFHPEACGGPTDTSFLFKTFLQSLDKGQRPPITTMSALRFHHTVIRKVLLIGSGGLSIGQAGEFDYSGSQAIKALKEEGIEVVLINPNIATVQTSKGLADKVYFLPATADFAVKVIQKERPDGILVSMGGQTALNVGVQLWESGVLQKYNVKVLGTPIDAIQVTEDREAFSACLSDIGEHSARSISANSVEDAVKAGETIGYPVLVRAAFALGGLGSGFADDATGLRELATRALAVSPQVIIDQDLRGWKEVEYEVVRDCNDNCITVCNMENFDPLGIHTGDSIVVAPSQTLSNREFYKLREVALKVVRKLGVVGECNIQYALDPKSERYCIIEVNARLSRSSALASKATGYPLAYVACKLALGKDLVDLRNTVTGTTTACFEPSLDYVTIKMPRWDLKKFARVSNDLGSSMKSVGEVMAIGRKFEETFQKALRMVDGNCNGFHIDPALHAKVLADPTLLERSFVTPSPDRVKYLASAFELGWEVEKIHQLTRIDRWFLVKLRTISDMSKALVPRVSLTSLTTVDLRLLKCRGFSDTQIADRLDTTEEKVRAYRKARGVVPCVKQIDTLAAEFPAMTNYLYVTYNGSENDVGVGPDGSGGVVVLGCGAYSIGSSVEFDWCAVSCIRTIKQAGLKTIVVNYNPETVSTDYDESDRLYFEELSLERILDIYEAEMSSGVIVSVGGQIPNNLAIPLKRCGANVLGTDPESIDRAEDRNKFSSMLDTLKIDQPAWAELKSIAQAKEFCNRVGFPVLVRPSYVLSGDAMCVVPDVEQLVKYMTKSSVVDFEHPVVISKFIENAKELEYDGVASNGVVMNYGACVWHHCIYLCRFLAFLCGAALLNFVFDICTTSTTTTPPPSPPTWS